MPNRIENIRSSNFRSSGGRDSRQLRSNQMAEALGGGGSGYRPYHEKGGTVEPSRQEVRIKFRDHDLQTTISRRATELLKFREGNTVEKNDSYSILKQTSLRGKDMQMNFTRGGGLHPDRSNSQEK